ncbi:hypothetical protein EMPS_04636 [Entomortierella parvispora]|uniref:DNA repair protein RAD5 n=1 Tax=Entomortierella parvispora TaxID=205924 RepID=A0A9P3LVR4_9FUNG|nr:hypothetical protein EMPS_04636 [Entomortierella parvispora]
MKARLNVCRQQLESNSAVNTAKRKEALREEIQSIELQIAKALGIEDDDDHSDPEHHKETSGGSITPESAHLPHISSPGCTRSPSPLDVELGTKRMRLGESSSTPPNSEFATFDGYSGEAPSSAAGSDGTIKEAESIKMALKEAGDDEDLDLDALLKQQSEMEQRWAEMKRKREEEDEAFARSMQEEEIQSFNKNNGISVSASGPGSNPGKLLMQSKLDRAKQEEEDEEMARLFAESDASSYSLATSPKKQNAGPLNIGNTTRPAQPVFSIFDQRAKAGASSSLLTSATTMGQLARSGQPSSSMPGSFPTPGNTFTDTPTATQAAAINILNSANAAGRVQSAFSQAHMAALQAQQQRASGSKAPAIDLTLPVIDLTKKVHEIESDDEEILEGTTWGLVNSLTQTFNSNNSGNWGYDEYDEFDYGYSDEDDLDGLSDAYERWQAQQSSSWAQSSSSYSSHYGSYLGQNRGLSQQESEKELRELLANIQASEEEIAPKDRTGTPDGMASHIALLEHQKIGLTWLQKMEEGSNRGGILADDMGLGKTVQTMALIVSRPLGPIDDPVIWDSRTTWFEPPPADKLVKTKATLVVAPVALVYQWEEELKSKTQPNLLKVHVYHGTNKFTDPELLRRYDVIITTSTTLSNEAGFKEGPDITKHKAIGVLFKAHFHRVVIDEAHTIKNKMTKASRACAQIAATYRWCLTGTPIQNNIDELYSLIRFLHIKPYCDWDEFRIQISTPMKKTKGYGPAMQRVQALLKAICLRRTKTSMVDGKPILELPERNVEIVQTPFSVDERAFYEALETRTRDRFNAYVRAGTVMKNYSNILVLLLRLRQACCHPHLIKDFEKATDAHAPEDQRGHIDALLDNLVEDVRRRLLERGMEAVECPICMDVGEESVILSSCGHIYCRACITAYLQQHEEEGGKCPECRRSTRVDDLIPVADFNQRFNPAPSEEELDPKGKGKADDNGDDFGDGKLPAVDVPQELDEWISSSKIDRMIVLVRQAVAKREKIIVFSQFTSLLHLIEKPLQQEGIKYLMYDGSMSAIARNDAVHRMTNDPSYPLMLISLKCGSLGLNLTVANHVVIMDPWWNPALENQAIDRVHRIGQRKNVFVHRLCIPETVEDRILVLQEKKQALADGALGEGAVPKLAKLGLQELMYLFRGG